MRSCEPGDDSGEACTLRRKSGELGDDSGDPDERERGELVPDLAGRGSLDHIALGSNTAAAPTGGGGAEATGDSARDDSAAFSHSSMNGCAVRTVNPRTAPRLTLAVPSLALGMALGALALRRALEGLVLGLALGRQ